MFLNKKSQLNKGLIVTLIASCGYVAPSFSVVMPHNTAQLDVSLGYFNKRKADFILRIPTQQAYGFDGEAQTPDQQKKVNEVVNSLRNNLSTLITTNQTLGCKYEINEIEPFAKENEKFEDSNKGKKMSMQADYYVLKTDFTMKCDTDLRGKQITVNLPEVFKDTNKIFVDLDGSQKKKLLFSKNTGVFRM